MFIFAAILITFSLFTVEAKLEALKPSENYTHKHVVDDENPLQYILFWKLVSKNVIQFEAHVKTTGWIGFGVSPNGGMKGADIAIGWVKGGVAYLKDCYATDKVKPLLDAKQDWSLVEGTEADGYTILKFKRNIETCDLKNDLVIEAGTNYVIFAWNDEDPVTGNEDWPYHGRKNRFSQSLALRDFKTQNLNEQNVLPANVKTTDLRMSNLPVASKDTYYYCQLFKLAPFEQKEHLVQFEMLVNQKNRRNVHHLLLYECEDSFVPKEFPWGHECGAVRIDSNVAQNCQMKMIVAWGIGGQANYSFPREAGYPFEKSDKSKYLFVEMHYDNPAELGQHC